MITFTNTEKTLREYGIIIQNLYRQNNNNAGYDPASELNSLTFNIESNNGNFAIVFNLPSYWRFSENGRGPGKMPPKGVLLKWMQWKHILPSPMQLSNGKTILPTMESLEFLIRRKIGRDGTKGSHTWELTENQVKDDLIRDLKKAITQDFLNYINPNKKGNN